MYLFRATGDHTYLQLGLDALESIERIAKTPCGYATVSSVCLTLKHFSEATRPNFRLKLRHEESAAKRITVHPEGIVIIHPIVVQSGPTASIVYL